MWIDYPTRSSFLKPCTTVIERHAQALRNGETITVHLSRQGYNGQVFLTVTKENPGAFWTEEKYKDPTRFPARIRAAAWALYREGKFGTFEVGHDTGTLTIRRVD
jgi:hypothetical protein